MKNFHLTKIVNRILFTTQFIYLKLNCDKNKLNTLIKGDGK
uniref:Uncharacterized protein n=1 Tax=Siphoviridae sp. ctLNL10 TaxID=2825453 RepID=A0A8S5Q3G5_9CAUD|nr:MAG TPA: hypothetical protein [Siphoviridae sp. ctLNL10]